MPVRAKLRLAAEIVAAYACAQGRLRRHGLVATVTGLRRPLDDRAASPAERDDARRIGHAVERTLGLLPGDTRCLMRALVLTALLGRRKVPSRLIIGARSAPAFAAHAWVEVAAEPVLPDGGGEYARLVEL